MTLSKHDIQNLFYKACKKGMAKLAAKCIEHGADQTVGDNYAIQWASENGHAAVVEILEKHLTKQKLQRSIK